MDRQRLIREPEAATKDETFYEALESALGHPVSSRPETILESLTDGLGTGHGNCRFTIVIPAFNEEDALADTLRDALRARAKIIEQTPVTAVRIILVNDGSTDRTQQIAEAFPEVTIVRFEHNRGYGAAIKAGFLQDESELVGFIDADGTLRHDSFIPLINRLIEAQADIVLGARLSPGTRMPLIRRIGNWGFARLLGFISGQPLSDCASGMRVMRRSSLKYLMPLPDGLHFTPAMSCIGVLDRRLRLCELPVPYQERIGRSKLHVLRDGVRFLTIILLSGCFYNPVKCGGCAILGSWVGAGLAMWGGWDPAWVLGTMLACDTLVAGVSLICHQAVKALIVARPSSDSAAEQILHKWTRPQRLAGLGCAGLIFAAAFTAAVVTGLASPSGLISCLAMAAIFWAASFMLLAISLQLLHMIRDKFEALIQDPFSHPRVGGSEAQSSNNG